MLRYAQHMIHTTDQKDLARAWDVEELHILK
jgi:hypothetical protein